MACGREHSALLIERPDGSPRVAMCGSNAFGQLGFDILPTNGTFARLQKFSVTELDSLNDVLGAGEQPVKVQCGLDHTVILTSNGRAFAMGWGADGQLGAGPESNDSFDRPVMVSGLGGTSLVDISSSTDFTLALTAERRLYYWGNAEYGQCMTGTKIDQVLAPIQIPFDYGLVAGIAAGGSHALVLTDAGQVYSCGYGALGLGAKAFAALQPELIRGLRDIAAIFASTDRCLAIDTHQQVYSWGLGNAAGRLGNGTAGANAFEPELLDMTACSLAVDSAMVALGNDIALVALR
ncbi:hypothetical protein EV174_003835 [Coemansia sp. RSA 2320]|nr:hypothetical protein EV174_003835 [Coemansia sp. RSA 2320]